MINKGQMKRKFVSVLEHPPTKSTRRRRRDRKRGWVKNRARANIKIKEMILVTG
jgi:hypothetical protein